MIAADLAAAFASLPLAWRKRLAGWTSGRQAALIERVASVSGDRPIGPPDPFRALRLTSPDAVKVVLFGQDPYPTEGHADGLAFSAGRGRPRSLARVFEILGADRPGWAPPSDWRLDRWAAQGVLLLNPVLSVEIRRSGSHDNVGWQALTAEIVRTLSIRAEAPTYLLWGAKAQRFFDGASAGGSAARVFATRHPSYDIRRHFMAEGSHFAATSDLVDWWDL